MSRPGGVFKRPVSRTTDPGVIEWLRGLSKAALADIFVDLVQQNLGDDEADGEKLLAALYDAAEPVMLARNDKLPRKDSWERARCKYAASLQASVLDLPRATPEERAQARADARRRGNEILAEGRALRPSFPWPSDR